MTWPQHRVEAYEKMVTSIRRLMNDPANAVPAHVLIELEQVIATAQMISEPSSLPSSAITEHGAESQASHAAGEPAQVNQPSPLDEPVLTDSQLLARWFWDRNLDITATNGLSPERCERFAREAGIEQNPPIEAWTQASALLAKMELLAVEEPDSPLLVRQFASEQAHWLETMPAGDPFSHGAKATANRAAKAKALARWLWDRNIDGPTMLGFTDKYRREIARNAGVNPPSSLATWQMAAVLIAQMEVRLAADPLNLAVARHQLDQHGRWATGEQIKAQQINPDTN